jgi:predicted transcriptional regulator of viral defense system
MNRGQAIEILRAWDKKGKYVFTKRELHKLFSQDSPKTFTEGINRLVKSNTLNRACRGIYVNPHALSFNSYTIEHIAKALRQGEYNYISLESVLSEYGVISQIPMDRITVMTTGREGTYKTIFGTIEYTHTKRPLADIIDGIKQIDNRPLRIASKEIAWRDLKRVGRNINMVNLKELNENSK